MKSLVNFFFSSSLSLLSLSLFESFSPKKISLLLTNSRQRKSVMKVRKGMKIKIEYERGENIFESQRERERERNEGGKKEE